MQGKPNGIIIKEGFTSAFWEIIEAEAKRIIRLQEDKINDWQFDGKLEDEIKKKTHYKQMWTQLTNNLKTVARERQKK